VNDEKKQIISAKILAIRRGNKGSMGPFAPTLKRLRILVGF